MREISASRARTKPSPACPCAARDTRSLTSVIDSRLSACMPGHCRSSLRARVRKPFWT
jgi:hypothetical protein